MAGTQKLQGKEKLYSDFYRNRISEQDLIQQITKIDRGSEFGNAGKAIKTFLRDLILPSWKEKNRDLL
ncbi:hypothetical protein [Methylocaldum sp. 14B]|jgi:hypothetical protein|uniref:hypothetical protein n=1 Tax=Methylocaldum sp. 14B TaxID=1912213 RepID=UPI00098A1584|nr:hypothetical protein [Methylocaldum sp. 14B]